MLRVVLGDQTIWHSSVVQSGSKALTFGLLVDCSQELTHILLSNQDVGIDLTGSCGIRYTRHTVQSMHGSNVERLLF